MEKYFQQLQNIYQDYITKEPFSYLGNRPDIIFQKTSIPSQVNPKMFEACFETQEVAIRPESIKEIIKEKIKSEEISLHLNHHIVCIKRTSDGFAVKTLSENNEFESDIVINCLWEGKATLDKQMGLKTRKDYNLRIKYGIITKSSVDLKGIQSFSILQGPYGDYVNFPQSNETYFSWYPSSMKGMIIDQNMPESWSQLCDGIIPNDLRQNLINENFKAFQRLIPQLSNFEVLSIKGGVIVAKEIKTFMNHPVNYMKEMNFL